MLRGNSNCFFVKIHILTGRILAYNGLRSGKKCNTVCEISARTDGNRTDGVQNIYNSVQYTLSLYLADDNIAINTSCCHVSSDILMSLIVTICVMPFSFRNAVFRTFAKSSSCLLCTRNIPFAIPGSWKKAEDEYFGH